MNSSCVVPTGGRRSAERLEFCSTVLDRLVLEGPAPFLMLSSHPERYFLDQAHFTFHTLAVPLILNQASIGTMLTGLDEEQNAKKALRS